MQNIKIGQVINGCKVVGLDYVRTAKYWNVEFDCKHTAVLPSHKVGKTKCSQCPRVPRVYKTCISSSYAYTTWTNMHLREKDRGIPVCAEWKDFSVFLVFYMESTGMTLQEIEQGRNGLCHFHAERLDKNVGWQPDNTVFVKFVTERANHKPTYKYWNHLLKKELLSEELHSYKEFLNTFGVKDISKILVRENIRLPHSKTNSHWVDKHV